MLRVLRPVFLCLTSGDDTSCFDSILYDYLTSVMNHSEGFHSEGFDSILYDYLTSVNQS